MITSTIKVKMKQTKKVEDEKGDNDRKVKGEKKLKKETANLKRN